MKRIYIDEDPSGSVQLPDDIHHYLKNVLRAKEGEPLGILTPTSFCEGVLERMENRKSFISITSKRPVVKPGYRLSVYQCALKREYMDFAVEKYAELGATEIIPVYSSRSLRELKDKTLARFGDISLKAVLQSENEHLPVIHEPCRIEDIEADNADRLLFYEREGESRGLGLTSRDVAMIIGPEGGFEPEEAEMLKGKGFRSVSPFKPILKAETAAVVFTGLVRMELE